MTLLSFFVRPLYPMSFTVKCLLISNGGRKITFNSQQPRLLLTVLTIWDLNWQNMTVCKHVECRYCLMCKTNSFHNCLYMLLSFGCAFFSFGYGLFSFIYALFSFSYTLFSFGYALFSFDYALFSFDYMLFSFGYVLFSSGYPLFCCALFSFDYALVSFDYALFSFDHVLFSFGYVPFSFGYELLPFHYMISHYVSLIHMMSK